jgi:hypothetical protein
MTVEANRWPESPIQRRQRPLTSRRADLARAGEPFWFAYAGKDFLAQASKLAGQLGEASANQMACLARPGEASQHQGFQTCPWHTYMPTKLPVVNTNASPGCTPSHQAGDRRRRFRAFLQARPIKRLRADQSGPTMPGGHLVCHAPRASVTHTTPVSGPC